MLTIRKVQMEALNEPLLFAFKEKLLDYLKHVDSTRFQDLGVSAARALIDRGLAKAQTFGINREFDVARFVEIMFLHGEDFETTPKMSWASDILEDSSMNGDTRMSVLLAHYGAMERFETRKAAN